MEILFLIISENTWQSCAILFVTHNQKAKRSMELEPGSYPSTKATSLIIVDGKRFELSDSSPRKYF